MSASDDKLPAGYAKGMCPANWIMRVIRCRQAREDRWGGKDRCHFGYETERMNEEWL